MAATKGLMDHLFMAACEWFLMFWMFIDAGLAYSLTRFAKYCQLQIPCLLCSRLDHLFGNEEHGSYLHLFCNKHQSDISYLIYCNLHNELVDVREMCADCFNSVTLQSQANLECYRFVVGQKGKERDGYQSPFLHKNLDCVPCSCCKSQWKEKSTVQQPVTSNVFGSRASKATTKPPLPRAARHGRPKKVRNRVKNRHRDAQFHLGYPEVKFTSDSEFEFLFSDDDDQSFKVVGVCERGLKDGGDNNRYKILGKHSYSTPDLRSALLLEAQLNERSRTRSASLTPNCLIRHHLAEMNQKTKESASLKAKKDKKPLSSMNVTRLSTDSINKADGSQNRYKIFSRNSFSASDLGSALLLEMHQSESLPKRSASLTPNCLFRHGLGEIYHKTKESDSLKAKKSLSSANSNRSLDGSMVSCSNGSQNRYKIFSRNSFSASDLRSALLQEMHDNRSLPRRSASLTPNSSSTYGLRDHKWPKNVHPKANKNKKPSSMNPTHLSTTYLDKTNGYGYLDDSVISRNMGNRHNRNKIPRRHSYSVFQLGGQILLNMPVDESLTSQAASLGPNSSMTHGLEESKKSKSHAPELVFLKKEYKQLPPNSSIRSDLPTAYIDKSKGYGSLDDSVVSRSMSIQNHNNIPRRHSYSFFELGCEILLNMPFNQSVTSCSSFSTQNGSINYGLGQPNNLNFPIRPSPSLNFMHFPRRKAKRDKKSLPYLKRGYKYGSLDDSVVSFNTGSHNHHNNNNNTRRHSYSAFELGCALLLNMQPIGESSTNRSATVIPSGSFGHGFGEPKKSGFQRASSSHSTVFLDKTKGYGSLDDSVVSRNTGSHTHKQNMLPRRHSYSVFQLGGDILLNMPMDDSLTGSTSMVPNDSIGHTLEDPQKSKLHTGEKDKKSLPPSCSVKNFDSLYDTRSDLSIDKSKWQGSFDDSLVLRSTGSYYLNNNPRRHSYSAFDLGRALLVEIHLDKSLKSHHAPMAPKDPTMCKNPRGKPKKDKKSLLPPNPMHALDHKTHGHQSLDDSVVSHKTGSHNVNNNPRRHSYSAFELGCALLLHMHSDGSLRRRSASLTPSCSVGCGLEELKKSTSEFLESQKLKTNEQSLPSMNSINNLGSSANVRSDLSSTSLYKPHGHGYFDDSVISHSRDGKIQYKSITRNYYSASDLTSPLLLQMNLDESLTSSSASLTPSCSVGQGLGELNSLTFQTGSTSSVKKRKKSDRSKAKKSKKSLLSANDVTLTTSSTNVASDLSSVSLDKNDKDGSFDDHAVSNNMGTQNRYNIFSRNSQSASDLKSVLLLEMHHDDSSRIRSKSLTPICYSSSQEPDSLDSMQFHVKKPEENNPTKDKKPLPSLNPTKEMTSPTNIRNDLCPACLDKIDLRSLDGSSVVSEIDIDGGLEKVKRQAEDDVRCMRLLQSELEAERNAATVAANHAMNMITRLQQEKASLQMEALQYLRMMEEQAEYDMEALQKANELVEEKEHEIQDLLDELEQYRSKYGDESMNNIKSLEDEKRYILESLSKLENKINQLSNGVKDNEKLQSDHLNDESSLSTHKDSSMSNGVHNKSQENENYVDSSKKMVTKSGGEVDFNTLEHELADLKEKMEALQADLDLLKHACNTLSGSDGLEFIQEIAYQLQELRRNMFNRSLISSN